jgi:hypothetical protein
MHMYVESSRSSTASTNESSSLILQNYDKIYYEINQHVNHIKKYRINSDLNYKEKVEHGSILKFYLYLFYF